MTDITWSSDTDWQNASKTDVTVENGSFQLANAIPDSEANQKLIHRYYLSDVIADQIGSYDGSNNGTVQVSGSWCDEAARSGDGSGDYINLNGSSGIDSLYGTNHAWAFSIQTTADEGTIVGTGTSGMWFSINIGGEPRTNRSATNGAVQFTIRESASGNVFTAEMDTTINDGNPHRVVFNKTDENKGQFYVDQSAVSTTYVDQQGSIYTSGESNDPITMFAFNDQALDLRKEHFLDGVVDDVCAFDSPLTSTEATSYNNPWS